MDQNTLVLTFGEIMLRLSPPDNLRIEQATSFDARYGGAEANTALSLAYQGDNAAYVSVVPANRIGDCALRGLRGYGVDTSRVVRSGDRLGTYYFELGASQRSNGCVYDRKPSAINMASHDELDWDSILGGVGVFYFSGVTPAISDEMALACKQALAAARERGIKCDGVHVGQSDIPVDVCRKLLGPDAIVGLSARCEEMLEYVKTADMSLVDYLGVGPLHETATKKDAGLTSDGSIVTQDFDDLRALHEVSPRPIVVGGGVKAADLPALKATGVEGFFVVSAVCSAPDPHAAAAELVETWRQA